MDVQAVQKNLQEKIKIGEHIPCGYSMIIIQEFDYTENKHTLYCRKDWMRKFYEFLRQHAKNIIGFKKRKILSLTKEKLEPYQDARNCYVCEKLKMENYQKAKDNCHFAGKYFIMPNKVPVAFSLRFKL